MYRDQMQWITIRHRVLVENVSRSQVARETGIDRKTIWKMIADTYPPPPHKRKTSRVAKRNTDAERKAAFDWMLGIMQLKIPLVQNSKRHR